MKSNGKMLREMTIIEKLMTGGLVLGMLVVFGFMVFSVLEKEKTLKLSKRYDEITMQMKMTEEIRQACLAHEVVDEDEIDVFVQLQQKMLKYGIKMKIIDALDKIGWFEGLEHGCNDGVTKLEWRVDELADRHKFQLVRIATCSCGKTQEKNISWVEN